MDIIKKDKEPITLSTANKYCEEDINIIIDSEKLIVVPSVNCQVKEGLFDTVNIAGDSELIAENIKSGVEIFGVIGTAEVRGEENAVIDISISAGSSSSSNLFKIIKEINTTLKPTGTTCSYMFANCSSLQKIQGMETSNITTMSQMFYGCTSLVEVPTMNTSKVKSMNFMFYNCKSLETIPLLDTSSVTNMNNMFNSCTNLNVIPLLDTSKVINPSVMFMGCTNLTTVPQFNMSSATLFSSMFTNCTKLSNESLNNIMGMCINATSITGTKTLSDMGLTSTQANICKTLSNYQAFLDAGWTTGY